MFSTFFRLLGLSLLSLALGSWAQAEPSRLLRAEFAKGSLIKGGPVFFRGRSTATRASFGFYVRPEWAQHALVVSMAGEALGSERKIRILVDRDPLDGSIELPLGDLSGVSITLPKLSTEKATRVEIVPEPGVRLKLKGLFLDQDPEAELEGSGTRVFDPKQEMLPLFEYFPMRTGLRTKLFNPDSGKLERLTFGRPEKLGAYQVRALKHEASAFTAWFEMRDRLWMPAIRTREGRLQSFSESPAILALGPWVMPGDEVEIASSKSGWTRTKLRIERGSGTKRPPLVLDLEHRDRHGPLDLSFDLEFHRGIRRLRTKSTPGIFELRDPSKVPPSQPDPDPKPDPFPDPSPDPTPDPDPQPDPDPEPDPDPTPVEPTRAEILAVWDQWLSSQGRDRFGRIRQGSRGTSIRLRHPVRTPDRLGYLQKVFRRRLPLGL